MITELRFLILGLLAREPRSAYALGRALAQMPTTGFSGSPGAVYPAVRALEREGLLTGRNRASKDARGRVYALTAGGRRVLGDWLRGPVSSTDLLRSPGTVLLRLSFLGQKGERARFKHRIARSARDALKTVRAYKAAAEDDLAKSSRQAFELTEAILVAYLQWANGRRARRQGERK